MRKMRWAAVLLLVVSLAGCILVHDDDDVFLGYDFNGLWSFALNGCQAQTASVEIFQNGSAFSMLSGGFQFDGSADPIGATFQARTDGPWGFWAFSGGATGDHTMAGTYVYADFRGECVGQWTGSRISFLSAGATSPPPLERR